MERQAVLGYRNADNYDRNRPTYPPEAVEELLNQLGVGRVAGARIIEIGAGTGKFTELLSCHRNGYQILAVEPHSDMRNLLIQKNLRGTTVLSCAAEQMDVVETGWADAVIAAQAFNWFASVETLEEIYRVLKSQSRLGLVWNVDDYCAPLSWQPTTAYEARLKRIVHALKRPVNQFRQEEWQKCFLAGHRALFSYPSHYREYSWTVKLSKHNVWERLCTMSQMAVMKGEELQSLRAEVLKALAGTESEGQEDEDEILVLHGKTVCYSLNAYPAC